MSKKTVTNCILMHLLLIFFAGLNACVAMGQSIRVFCSAGENANVAFAFVGEGSVNVDWGAGDVRDYDGKSIAGVCHGDTITINMASTIIGFECANQSLSWIDLNDAPQLISINCSNNQLTALNTDSLTELQDINCSNNSIAELSFAGNPDLRYIDCAYNNIEGIDVSNNPCLQVLICSYNHLSGVKVNKNPELRSLWAEGNELMALDLTNCHEIRSLVAPYNGMEKLDLDMPVTLNDLWVNNNNLTTLYLCGADSIFSADISNNKLGEISLDGFSVKNKTYLFDCSNNMLTLKYIYPAAKVTNYVIGNQGPIDCGYDSLAVEQVADFASLRMNAAGFKVGSIVIKDAKTDVQLVKGNSSNDYQDLMGRIRFYHAVDSVYMIIVSNSYPDLEIRTNNFVVYDPEALPVQTKSVSGPDVTCGNGKICLHAALRSTATVVGLNGCVIWRGVMHAGDYVTIPVEPGVYIINGSKYKIY